MDTHPHVRCYDYDHGNRWASFRCTCEGCAWFITKENTRDRTPEEVREEVCADHDYYCD
jgi:hypothetical protein